MVKEARNPGGAGQDPVQRHVVEAREVGGADHQAGGGIDRPGQTDAERPHLARPGAVELQGFGDGLDDSVDDVPTAAGGFGRVSHHGPQPAASIGDRDSQLGAAEVDSDEGHQRQRGRGSGRNVAAASTAPIKSAMAVARKIRWYSSKIACLTLSR